MSVKDCPQCHCHSLEQRRDKSWWCLYASCGYEEHAVDELMQLREQNRVLATHLSNLVEWALEVTKDWVVDDDSTLANDLRMIWQAQAALTATSQPQ